MFTTPPPATSNLAVRPAFHELASELPVTRQAVAKHLASLVRAGLVRGERRGRETRYELTPAPLGEAMAWLTSVCAEWDARLAALSAHLQSER